MSWKDELLASEYWSSSTPEQKSVLLAIILLSDDNDEITVGLNELAQLCGKGITISQVRTALNKMEKSGVIRKQIDKQNRKQIDKQINNQKSFIKLVKSTATEVEPKKVSKQIDKQIDKQIRKQISKQKPVVEKHQKYSENEELDKTILDFISNRKSLKKPMTDKAITLMLNKLDKLARTDAEKIEILNQSILNGWQGIFPLQGDRNGANKKQVNTNETDEIRAMWGFD